MWFEELHWAILMLSEYCINGRSGMRPHYTTWILAHVFLLPDCETGIRDSWASRGRCSEREEQIFRKHGQKFVKKKDESLKNIFIARLKSPFSHCYSLRLFFLLFLCPLSCCLHIWLYSCVPFLTPNQINSVLWHTPAISQVSLLQSFPPSGSFVCL